MNNPSGGVMRKGGGWLKPGAHENLHDSKVWLENKRLQHELNNTKKDLQTEFNATLKKLKHERLAFQTAPLRPRTKNPAVVVGTPMSDQNRRRSLSNPEKPTSQHSQDNDDNIAIPDTLNFRTNTADRSGSTSDSGRTTKLVSPLLSRRTQSNLLTVLYRPCSLTDVRQPAVTANEAPRPFRFEESNSCDGKLPKLALAMRRANQYRGDLDKDLRSAVLGRRRMSRSMDSLGELEVDNLSLQSFGDGTPPEEHRGRRRSITIDGADGLFEAIARRDRVTNNTGSKEFHVSRRRKEAVSTMDSDLAERMSRAMKKNSVHSSLEMGTRFDARVAEIRDTF